MGATNTVPVNKAWDENFFMIKIQSDFPDAITLIGLPPTSDIIRLKFNYSFVDSFTQTML